MFPRYRRRCHLVFFICHIWGVAICYSLFYIRKKGRSPSPRSDEHATMEIDFLTLQIYNLFLIEIGILQKTYMFQCKFFNVRCKKSNIAITNKKQILIFAQ